MKKLDNLQVQHPGSFIPCSGQLTLDLVNLQSFQSTIGAGDAQGFGSCTKPCWSKRKKALLGWGILTFKMTGETNKPVIIKFCKDAQSIKARVTALNTQNDMTHAMKLKVMAVSRLIWKLQCILGIKRSVRSPFSWREAGSARSVSYDVLCCISFCTAAKQCAHCKANSANLTKYWKDLQPVPSSLRSV